MSPRVIYANLGGHPTIKTKIYKTNILQDLELFLSAYQLHTIDTIHCDYPL